ncbi:MAG: hypothetical protein M3Y87_33370 [Myxococcota bacterium]|nr:hypothetical protein [Myxococcota bacterium]
MNIRFVSLLAALALTACGSSTSPAADAAVAPVDAPVATTATLHGEISRTGMPRAGGVGDLFVAVFDRDPVVERDNAMVVAATRLEAVDFSAADATVAYEVAEIPPRAEPYFVIAFLDDNGTVTDPTMAVPDSGDLITLQSFAAPTFTASEPARVELDLVLNFNLP